MKMYSVLKQIGHAANRSIHIQDLHTKQDEASEDVSPRDSSTTSELKDIDDKLACDICGKVSKTSKAKSNHIWFKHGFTCDICYVRVSLKETVESHILKKHTHKCEDCNFTSYTIKQLQRHIDSKLHCLKCELCDDDDKTFSTPEERKQHFEELHNANMCYFCNEKFDSKTDKKKHMLGHHKCNICNASLPTTEERRDHIDRRHRFQCTRCLAVFLCPALRRKHTCLPNVQTNQASAEESAQFYCNICEKLFETEKNLQQHRINSHHYEYKCLYCSESFILTEGRDTHMNLVHLIKCTECSAILHTQEQLKAHELKEHSDLLRCKVCNIICLSIEEKNKHDSDNYCFVCNFCEKPWPSKVALDEHVLQCFHQIRNINFSGENQRGQHYTFKCNNCNSFWKTSAEREQHFQLTHTVNCNICKKGFKREMQGDQHYVESHLFNCEECNGKWWCTELRDKHVKDFHSQKPILKSERSKGRWATAKERRDDILDRHAILCRICGIQFSTDEDLDIHYLATHFFKCDKCGGTFATENLRYQHYEDFHSLLEFTTASERENHKKSVRGQFTCPLCGMSLQTRNERDQHISLIHTWNCTVCSKSFKTKSDKDQHIQLVHLHTCEICDNVFTTDYSLDRHMKMMHQWDPEECSNSEHFDETFLCSECNEAFESEEDLVGHYKSQHIQWRPRVFFDIIAGNIPMGRIVMELRMDIVPKTAENFLQLCTGEKGFGYEGSTFYLIDRNNICQGGDITNNSDGGMSIYGRHFPQENFDLKHSDEGILSMVRSGSNTNNSHFTITMNKMERLDNTQVVFGRVVEGMDVVKKMNNLESMAGIPFERIVILNCGQLKN